MFRFLTLVPALAAFVAAQDITTTDASATPIPTPDALPLADLREFEPPTYTSQPGLMSEITSYVSATAIASASIQQSESPLSVFPAVTAVPLNAAGEDDADDGSNDDSASGSAAKRGLQARTACAPQATIANYYSVNVDTYASFTADPIIASVASAAPTPTGYFQNFKNLPGANSAYAYMGYSVIKTGYDVNSCASKCDAIKGCLAFNIYFELDPTVSPGSSCPNPPGFANIKCSFWGAALDASTATNKGQYQSSFHVGIAGSNAYTSFKVGGPVNGFPTMQSLNNSAMNAPLRDCGSTWTYMGYKLFQSGPFDPTLCAAACNAQTAYDFAHPPSTGQPATCAAFGTYMLTMTNKTGSYVQGQMCTMYTSNWDKQYAVNTVSYDDSIGAKYTYSYSFFYSNPDIQPICTTDINYLISSGSDFCTSYNSYSAPSTSTTTTLTPSQLATVTSATTVISTSLISTSSPTTTVTGNVFWRRDSNETASVETVASVPAYSVVMLTSTAMTTTVANGTVPTDAPSNVVQKRGIVARSAIPTPTNVAGWPASRISQACSQVATGTSTMTSTVSLQSSTTTVYSTASIATTLAACIVPTEVPAYENFVPIWGAWQGDSVASNPQAQFNSEQTMQLPFRMCIAGQCSNALSVGTDGYFYLNNLAVSNRISVFSAQSYGLYLYRSNNGVYYRITGDIGSRQFTLAWYAGTVSYGHEQNHFTVTYFEDQPGELLFKYYDTVQTGSGPQAYAKVQMGNTNTQVWGAGQYFTPGMQFKITTGDGSSAVGVAQSQHDRIDCCTKNYWHSCTEFQPPAK